MQNDYGLNWAESTRRDTPPEPLEDFLPEEKDTYEREDDYAVTL